MERPYDTQPYINAIKEYKAALEQALEIARI